MVEVDEPQEGKSTSAGKILLEGRLRAGLTQEQVAKELYMTVGKVKALETDDYGRLNSDTFIRGYIRAYANLLKLDVVQVLAAYEQVQEENKPVEVKPVVKASVASESRGSWQFLLIIGAFFLGLWLISVWFFDNHPETPEVQYVMPPPSALPKIAAIPASSSSASSPASSVASAVKSASASAQSSHGDVKNVVVSEQKSSVAESVSSSSSSQSSSAKKTTLDEISFSFRAECWVEVSDSRGDVLVTELQASGSRIKLVGQAPFDVKLGNAPAVDIQLNGKKVDVIPLIGSNVLILKVGE